MSHPCPDCDQTCYCDGEDSRSVSDEWIAKHCNHDCEPEECDDDQYYSDWFDDEDEDEDEVVIDPPEDSGAGEGGL